MNDTPTPIPEFRDRCDRVWRLEFTVGDAARIRKAHGLDFLNAHNGAAITAVSRDDNLLAMVVWELCREQADALGVSFDDWGAGIDGATLGQAADALGVAIVNFSPPARRPVMQAMMDQATAAATQLTERAAAKIREANLQPLMEGLMQERDRRLDQALQAIETSGK
jgi:hypothetical protein